MRGKNSPESIKFTHSMKIFADSGCVSAPVLMSGEKDGPKLIIIFQYLREMFNYCHLRITSNMNLNIYQNFDFN